MRGKTMGTKNNPGDHDCHEKAYPDEPMFTLLARDPIAPMLIRLWVAIRQRSHPNDEVPKHVEAIEVAEEMEYWHASNRL